ncbi:MAG: sugar kinase [Candidatus Riflebacteria bacterium]|nr:sugar kinase [Candidatus Riflebacteria bacterium]
MTSDKAEKKVKLVAAGSVAYDDLATPKGVREKSLGGSAVYFSTVASFFAPVGMVGVAGNDFEESDRDFLRSRKINLDGLALDKNGPTFRWKGEYGANFGDATTHSTCLNVFENFDPVLTEEYKNADFLFLANIHPALQIQIIKSVKNPKIIGLDTMNFWIDSEPDALREAISMTDILFVNRQEALQLSGEKTFAKSVETLLKMGAPRIVIKLGELGAMTATADSRFFVPAFPSKNLTDPTGAGDSFGGGFMGNLARTGDISEANIRRSMLYGSVMGSLTVEGFSIDVYKTLSPEKIEQRFEEIKKMISI